MKARRKQRQKRTHGVSWVLLVAFLACGIIAFGTVQGVLGIINSWLEDLPSVEDSAAFNYAQKTRVYAADGTTLLAEFFLENREPVSIEQVSPYVLTGTVDTEDVRFYEHNGVDPQGIGRALWVNLRGGAMEGASTITQQFVRATLLSGEATEISVKRKVREAQLAVELEKIYSKEDILMMYLNTINYGDGAYGIEAAARNYFSKTALDLSLTEAATLVAIPQSPNFLNPKTNPDGCWERRNLVLLRMLENKNISQEEYDAAIAEPLALNPPEEKPSQGILAYPYFTSFVREQLLKEFSVEVVFKGGLTVYTTIRPDLQEKAEEACRKQYMAMADDLEVSLTAVDPKTGYILAMVGGKDYYRDQWNLATQSARHAGSSFKPFVLVAAIEKGISPNTKIDCSSPITLDGWRVENYAGGSMGVRTITQATAASSNTAYAQLIQEVGADTVYETAKRMGIKSEDTVGRAMALGAYGVNTLEMASAYGTLATNGVRHDETAITLITDYQGNTLYEHVDNPQQVLSPEVAYATTQVLKTVLTSGTAGGYSLAGGQVSAGKTGTSEQWRDSWFAGYTPQLSAAAWIGCPTQERSMPASLVAVAVWRDFMNAALQGIPAEDFTPAADPSYNSSFNKKQGDKHDINDPNGAPDVSGLSLSEAKEDLQGYEVDYVEVYSDSVPPGIVVRQAVDGKKVVLYVSKGADPNKKPTTPNPPISPPGGGSSGGSGGGQTPDPPVEGNELR